MNQETEPAAAITDEAGAAHLALMLAREPVARAVIERYEAGTSPHYADPVLACIYLAAAVLQHDGQQPTRDDVVRQLRFWTDESTPEESDAHAALEAIDSLPTEEALQLDETAAIARTVVYEDAMAARAGAPPKPRAIFPLVSLSELQSRPAPDWLIDNVLVCGKTSLLTAKHASFKSFFSLDMGLCIATGTAWHTHPVKPGPVVYVAAEGASGLVKRVRAWCIENAADLPANFHIIERPAQVHQPALRKAFEAAVKEVQPALIVLDTLARCAVGLDENSAKDMGEFADALGLLAEETGAHVMTVHHNNKGGEYRGSSAVPAAVDTHLSMNRDGKGDSVTLKCEKQKDGEEFADITFTKQVVVWDGSKDSLVFRREATGYQRWGGLSTADTKYLKQLVEGFGSTGASNSQWRQFSEAEGGFTYCTFQRSVRKLHSDGYITCPDPGKRGAVYKPDMEKCAKALDDLAR